MLLARCIGPLLIVMLESTAGIARAQAIGGPVTPSFSTFQPIAPVGVARAIPAATYAPKPVLAVRDGQKSEEVVRQIMEEDRRSVSQPRMYTGPFHFADPSVASAEETAPFRDALRSLSNMLSVSDALDLRKALYAIEHPVQPSMSYATFSGMVEKLAAMVRYKLVSEGLDPEDPLAKHYGIQRLFIDTLIDPATGRRMPPLRYDLEDFSGEGDPAQLTVGKLLLTGEGQCRSMPLLYLLVAEALGAEAFWAFSPNHSYIKFRDAQGTFFNFETTNGHLTSDAWVAGSGYVKAEAVRSRVYLDTVGTRRAVAHLLVDLAIAYGQRFGYDQAFMGACLDKALEEFPNDIHGWLERSNLSTACFDRAAFEAGYPPLDQLGKVAPALELRFRELKQLYVHVDGLGFSEMPSEAYATWLRSLEEEKQKRAEERFREQLWPTPLRR